LIRPLKSRKFENPFLVSGFIKGSARQATHNDCAIARSAPITILTGESQYSSNPLLHWQSCLRECARVAGPVSGIGIGPQNPSIIESHRLVARRMRWKRAYWDDFAVYSWTRRREVCGSGGRAIMAAEVSCNSPCYRCRHRQQRRRIGNRM